MSEPQFTEMDLHCIARLIQSSFQAPKQKKIRTCRPLYGCMYCKYAIECVHAVESRGERFHYHKVFKKMEELTGVHLSGYQSHLSPEDIGRIFFPASYYMEHPEVLHELEKVHPERMMQGFKDCLDSLIDCSKESPGQK